MIFMSEKRCFGCMAVKQDSPICEHCGYDERSFNASHQLPVGTLLGGRYVVGRVIDQTETAIRYMGWDKQLELSVILLEFYPQDCVTRDCAVSDSLFLTSRGRTRGFIKLRKRFVRDAKALADKKKYGKKPKEGNFQDLIQANDTLYCVLLARQPKPAPKKRQKKAAPSWLKWAAAVLVLAALAAVGLKYVPLPEKEPTLEKPAPVETTLPEETTATQVPTEAPTEAPTEPEPTVDPSLWMDNVLMSTYNGADFDLMAHTYQYKGRTVYRSAIRNDQVRSVTFLDTLASEPADSWDVSADQNGTVKAWSEQNGDLYDLYIAAEGGINGAKATRKMFVLFSNLEEVHFGTAFHTDETTDMSSMFHRCQKLISVDLQRFDTSNVTNMQSIFFGCTSLTNLDVSSFDTSKVTDMTYMFYGCSSLSELDLHNFDTANVTEMAHMFRGCNSLTSLDLSSFDTSNVTSMFMTFTACSSLTGVDVSSFDTSCVQDMEYMFSGCASLKTLDLSNFNTAKVDTMEYMFNMCSALTELDVSSFDTSSVNNMNFMFNGCSSLTQLDVSGFNTQKVAHMWGMFQSCASLTSLDVRNFDTSHVIKMENMFRDCTNLKKLDLSGFTHSQANKQDMLTGCASLTTVNEPSLDRLIR